MKHSPSYVRPRTMLRICWWRRQRGNRGSGYEDVDLSATELYSGDLDEVMDLLPRNAREVQLRCRREVSQFWLRCYACRAGVRDGRSAEGDDVGVSEAETDTGRRWWSGGGGLVRAGLMRCRQSLCGPSNGGAGIGMADDVEPEPAMHHARVDGVGRR